MVSVYYVRDGQVGGMFLVVGFCKGGAAPARCIIIVCWCIVSSDLLLFFVVFAQLCGARK